MVDHLLNFPLAYQPGTRWHYSMSTAVCARLVEIISEQPIDRFLQQRIFDPLVMRDTSYHVPPQALSHLAELYSIVNCLIQISYQRSLRKLGSQMVNSNL